MNAPSQAALRVLPSSLSAWQIPGLQRRPSTILSGAHELGLSTSLALLAELVLARELGLLTSLALLAGELVLATETEARFPLETGIHFPLELETNTCFPLETRIRFPLELETNTRFPLVLNVLVLSALLSAPFVLSPTETTVGAVRASGATKTLRQQQWGGAQTTIN